MTQGTPAARTPGARRAGPGEYLFELAKIDPSKDAVAPLHGIQAA